MLNQVYELETALLRTQRNEQELRDAVSKAKYDLRTARQDQIEYGSTFRAFLDRFSGKRAGKEEQLSREVRKAEAELNELEGFRMSKVNLAAAEGKARRYDRAVTMFRKSMSEYAEEHKGVEKPVEETVGVLKHRLDQELYEEGLG